MLAAELLLGGVKPVVLEQLAEISQVPKGNGLVGQIVQVLDYRGLLEPLRVGTTYAGPVPAFNFGPLRLEFSQLDHSPLDVLAIPQRRLEQRLADRVAELGGTVRRGHELTGLEQDEEGVSLRVRGPDGEYRLRARYVAGCDGAHSLVRKQAGIDFPGVTSREVSRIGRVRLQAAAGELRAGARTLRPMELVRTETGLFTLAPLASLDAQAPPGTYIVHTREDGEAAASPDGEQADGPMTLDDLRASVQRVLGADLPMSDPLYLTKIVGNSRQADSYQSGRVLLAGDAAHVFGIGGSLNAGLLDAVNLGWKLAAEVDGRAPPNLLHSYHVERHAAGQRTIMQTRVQRALSRGGEYAEALRELFGELLQYADTQRHLGELLAGSDFRHDAVAAETERHPQADRLAPGRPRALAARTGALAARTGALAGLLAPDLALELADGTRTRVAELMRAATPLLLDFTPDGLAARAAAEWTQRVPALKAKPLATSSPVTALLVRPDAYIAWAGGPEPADVSGLEQALRTWFGS